MLGQSQPPQAADGSWVSETVRCSHQYSPCQHTHLISLTQQHDNVPFSISKQTLSSSLVNQENLEGKYGMFSLLCKSQQDMLLDICLMLSFSPQWVSQTFPKVVGKGFSFFWVVYRGRIPWFLGQGSIHG